MSDNSSSRPKGQNDPGWNDPPKLQFNTVQSGNKTRLNLNKRVAFPLHGNSSTTSKPTAIVHPTHPPVTTPPVAIVPPMARTTPAFHSDVNSTHVEARLDEPDSLPDAERQLCLDTFNSLVPRVQVGINGPDEVQSRINLMNQMWLSGTLAPAVQRGIRSIAQALNANNFNEAIEFHRALLIEHSNMCSAWGTALRQLILTIQPVSSENSTQISQQDELASEPATLSRQPESTRTVQDI